MLVARSVEEMRDRYCEMLTTLDKIFGVETDEEVCNNYLY